MDSIGRSNRIDTFQASESPILIDQAPYATLGIEVPSGTTVSAIECGLKDGTLDPVTLQGTNFLYPGALGNATQLYTAGLVKITFSGGPITVIRKG